MQLKSTIFALMLASGLLAMGNLVGCEASGEVDVAGDPVDSRTDVQIETGDADFEGEFQVD